MSRTRSIRYHARWVRMLCCLAVGIGIGNAVFFDGLSVPETAIRDYVIYSESTLFRYAPPSIEILVVLGLCLVAAWVRFKRPLLMVLSGGGMVVGYVFIYMTILLTLEYVLPAVAPLLAILSCSGMLETMAWSEERSRRRELEDIDRARQQFIDMLVHDLRRRVSSVLSSASVLERAERGQPTDEALSTLRTSADRIMLLVNDLLDIRKVEEGVMALDRQRTPLRPLLLAAIAQAEDAAAMAELSLSLACPETEEATVDQHIFARVMANLLWNAVQHGSSGSTVELACRQEGAMTVVSVGNRGPTIAAAEQESVFRAFVSGHGNPDNVATDSTGLGLSFCRLAMEAHGGSITLESPWSPHSDGVNVVMTLPTE